MRADRRSPPQRRSTSAGAATTGNETLVVDLTNGPLAPGLTPEGAGLSEIEINANLGLAAGDRITVTGAESADNLLLGAGGINLNGDDDADVATTNTELFTLNGGGANDFISAQGGSGTGGPATLPATINGDAGDDTIKPGLGNDTVAGGVGSDAIDGSDAPTAIAINLATTAAQNTGGLGTDTISGFENVRGSPFADTLTGDGGANFLGGLGGDDRLNGASGDDTIDGDEGNDTGDYSTATAAVTASLSLATQDTGAFGMDTLLELENLTGGSGADSLIGSSGANTLRGGGGNDVLEGGLGDDEVEGDAGTDTASAQSAAAGVRIDLRAGTLTGADGADTLSEIESADGSPFDDTMIGDELANALNGSAGTDTVDYSQAIGGLALNLQTGSVTGAGATDSLSQIESAIGTPFDDTLTGSTVSNSLRGGGGDDTVIGAAGDDTLDGGAGRDLADYATSTNPLSVDLGAGTASGRGDDTLRAIENLTGGAGNDFLAGDARSNLIVGGAGLDRVAGGDGDDSLDGGAGLDTLDLSGASASVDVDLVRQRAQGQGSDAVISFEDVIGSAHPDQLSGDVAANRLVGGGGDDSLRGKAGDDELLGGDGSDTITYSGFSPDAEREGVTVDLNHGRASGEGDDRVDGVENVIGSNFADALRGDAGANRLEGRGGEDELAGVGGDDFVDLGSGSDRGAGGVGSDRLSARDGRRDKVFGGGGRDSARVDKGLDRVRRVEKR